MLHRCTVDHYITSYTPPLPIQIIPIPVQVLWHFITCENILTLSSALHKSMDSAYLVLVLHLFSISQYSYPWRTYHMFVFLCHTFVSFYHVFLFYSTCYFSFFHMLVAIHYLSCFSSFLYISIEYLSCIFPVLNINSVHPSFLTSPQKSTLSIWNQGHIGDEWHNTYVEAYVKGHLHSPIPLMEYVHLDIPDTLRLSNSPYIPSHQHQTPFPSDSFVHASLCLNSKT